MRSHVKKIQRLDPVIAIRKKRVDEESGFLVEIRQEKSRMESELVAWQQRYLDGVGRLNEMREAGERNMLAAMEAAVDHAREQLFSLFTRLKEVDGIEHAQVLQLNAVQRDLSAVERLQENHREKLQKAIAKAEQKVLDDVALRRFIQSR